MSPPTRAPSSPSPHWIKAVLYACACARCSKPIRAGERALRDPTRGTPAGGVAFYCERCGPERLNEQDARPRHQARPGEGGSQTGMFA